MVLMSNTLLQQKEPGPLGEMTASRAGAGNIHDKLGAPCNVRRTCHTHTHAHTHTDTHTTHTLLLGSSHVLSLTYALEIHGITYSL